MANNIITHRVTVLSADGRNVVVAVDDVDDAVCSACAARAVCRHDVSTDKAAGVSRQLVVEPLPGRCYHAGDKVVIAAAESTRWHAIFLNFIMPCLLLLAGVALNLTGISELMSLVVAVIVVGVYYGALYLLRQRLASRFRWKITEIC